MKIGKSGVRGLAAIFGAAFLAAAPAYAAPGCDSRKKGGADQCTLPLKTTGALSFTTQEGTWMSLDAAADGRSLYFDLLGDIYRLGREGGRAEPILTGLAFETQPTISPDGAAMAFISDRDGAENVWIANIDGSGARRLTANEGLDQFTSPAWSADGKYVFVSRLSKLWDVFDIWMYHTQGGAGVQVTKNDQRRDVPYTQRMSSTDPAPSPDGRYLYFTTRQGSFDYNSVLPLWTLMRRDLVTGAQETVVAAQGSAMRPALSPDGRLLAYAAREDGASVLRLRDLETGEDRVLAPSVQRDAQEELPMRGLLPAYSFTPDSSKVLIAYGGGLHELDARDGEARDIPFRADVRLDIGSPLDATQKESGVARNARIIQSPRVSPDGRLVAFSALGAIYTAPLSAGGGAPQRVSPEGINAFQPVWSPDGRTLAYVSWSSEGGHLWKTAADGGEPARLSETAAAFTSPVFSPDGAFVFALRGGVYDRLNNYSEAIGPVLAKDIVRVGADGGPVERVATAMGAGNHLFSADAGNLHFAGSPARLHFFAGDGVYSVDENGADRRAIIAVQVASDTTVDGIEFATNVRVSPDGRWALARLGSQLHLVAAPRLGGEMSVLDLKAPSVAYAKIAGGGADSFDWADGGRSIVWSAGSTLYRLSLAAVNFIDPAKTPAPQAYPMDVPFERDVRQGARLLRGATALTMKGDEAIENADILVVGDRIAAVGPNGGVKVPAGADIVDVTGRFITPGFVDTHAHWTDIRRGVFDDTVWSLPLNLAYGVTAGLDPQAFTSDMFVYQDLVDAGRILGPRAYSTGAGIFSTSNIQSEVEAENLLRLYRDHYGTRNIKAYASGNREQRQWIVNASRKLGMIPTTEGALNTGLDLTHAIDGFAGNEHAMPTTPLYRDVIELYARTGIGYTPTLLVSYGGPWAQEKFFAERDPASLEKIRRFMPQSVIDQKTTRRFWVRPRDQVYPALAKGAADIYRAGGRIGVGSHGEFQGLGYHWEMEALTSGGLTPHEVLQIATRVSADIIGRETDIGTIEAGKYADLVILEKDPRADIRNTTSILFVMKNGRLYDDETLNEVK
ncbi:MAG: PD40 domain-containing protein [Parvularculaceae bacterium]|nr:PD40 domain-containing protein [Parvularculaceae bacterium]